MKLTDSILKNEEKALYALRALYSRYGYSHFKVSKFEEYDLYARNKSFLVSENILSFTDTNGKLMALKPDITLSIVKNLGDDHVTHKVYYNETVYRTSAGYDGFREIMQTGLECIGEIDLYAICEVLTLAQKSLAVISDDSILDISHMGFLTGLLEAAGVSDADMAMLLKYIGNKNSAAILSYCAVNGIDREMAERICRVTALYAPMEQALTEIKPLLCGEKMQSAYDELCRIFALMKLCGNTEKLYLDFSMIHDLSYYNGVVFRGFINGIPDSVLSGGRYDRLLGKMGKNAGAIGFAVYLNLLERFGSSDNRFDTDVLIICESDADTGKTIEMANALRAEGKRVRVQKQEDGNVRYKELVRIGSVRTEA